MEAVAIIIVEGITIPSTLWWQTVTGVPRIGHARTMTAMDVTVVSTDKAVIKTTSATTAEKTM